MIVIARHYKLCDPLAINLDDSILREDINESELKAARIITARRTWFPVRSRACVRNALNALAADTANSHRGGEDDDNLFDDAEYEDDPMPDAFAPGSSSGADLHCPVSSATGELAQLRADFQALRTDFGDFRTKMFSRQDRMETTLTATHNLLIEQAQLWRLSQEQSALHYQQVLEHTRQVAALNEQWSSWASMTLLHPRISSDCRCFVRILFSFRLCSGVE